MNFKEFLMKQNGANEFWIDRYIKFINVFGGTRNGQVHHILPRSLFPEFINEKGNLVKLSHRSHFIAHFLLSKAISGKMLYAFNMMSNFSGKFKSRIYEKEYKRFLEQVSEDSSKRIVSETTKIKLSNIYHNKSASEKELINEKISISKKGIKCKEETKAKISKTKKEKFKNEEYSKREYSGKEREEISKRFKKYYSENGHFAKGKSYEEIYGTEKAKQLKLKRVEQNKNISEETRKKISEKLKGIPKTEETKKKLSNLAKERSKRKVVCGYCGKKVDKANFSRWHGENCKRKNDENND